MTTTDLTLPGGHGWIRGCSPVIWDAPDGGRYQGVVGNLYDGGARVIITQPYPVRSADYREREGTLGALGLRLQDATGRVHATWWLAEHFEGTIGHGVTWGRTWHNRRKRWALLIHQVRCYHFHPEEDHRSRWYVAVSSLASLDGNDPRTLPDGSRWVDAEALRLVCLHAAGLEVAP